MTYVECYDAVIGKLSTLSVPLYEVYQQGLERPCAVVEAHPSKSQTLNAQGVMNEIKFLVTYMPQLDQHGNIINQRDMMQFTDEVLSLFGEFRLPDITLNCTSTGNTMMESYIELIAKFANTMQPADIGEKIRNIDYGIAVCSTTD